MLSSLKFSGVILRNKTLNVFQPKQRHSGNGQMQ